MALIIAICNVRGSAPREPEPLWLVFSTTDGIYADATAVAIQSLLLYWNPEGKKIGILVLGDQLTPATIARFQQMGVRVENIADRFLELADRYIITGWNRLVSLQPWLPEILPDLGIDGIFCQMDSDIFVMRDLVTPLIEEASRMTQPISAVNQSYVTVEHASDVRLGTSLGAGVVLWDLRRLAETGVSLSEKFQLDVEDDRMFGTPQVQSLIRNLIGKGRDSEALQTLDQIVSKPRTFYDDSDGRTPIEKLAQNDVLKNDAELVSILREINDRMQGKLFIRLNCAIGAAVNFVYRIFEDDIVFEPPEDGTPFVNCNGVFCQEATLSTAATLNLPLRSNLLVKNICPWLEKPRAYPFLRSTLIPSSMLSTLIAYAKSPAILDHMAEEFANVLVLHFDGCRKPWDPNFTEGLVGSELAWATNAREFYYAVLSMTSFAEPDRAPVTPEQLEQLRGALLFTEEQAKDHLTQLVSEHTEEIDATLAKIADLKKAMVSDE
ncbi:MAG: hypothetical protein LBJ92_04335 [Holosporales bacterium]|nr:hypothetical protein [Holosporales bacterium]